MIISTESVTTGSRFQLNLHSDVRFQLILYSDAQLRLQALGAAPTTAIAALRTAALDYVRRYGSLP